MKILKQETSRNLVNVDTNLIKNVKIFDVFSGGNMPAGKKSIVINVLIQSKKKHFPKKTLMI